MRIQPLQIFGEAAKYLLIGVAVLYVMDWTVFEVRRARGTATGSVSVEKYLQTPLKGGKAEYDYLGTADESCSRTLFPQYAAAEWSSPCWWLERHRTRWE